MSGPRTTGSTRSLRSVELYCPELLRPLACVAADALEVRGFTVTIAAGSDARARLTEARPASKGPAAKVLRVICLGERLDASTRTRLRAALDPSGRGALCLVHASSPRKIVEAVLEAIGEPQSRRAPRRTTRSFLANPTMVERQAAARPWARYVAAAAVGLLAMAWTMRSSTDAASSEAGSRAPSLPRASAPQPPASSSEEIVFTNTAAPKPTPQRIDEDRREAIPVLHRPGARPDAVPGPRPEASGGAPGPALDPAPLEAMPKRQRDRAPAPKVPTGVVPQPPVGWGTGISR